MAHTANRNRLFASFGTFLIIVSAFSTLFAATSQTSSYAYLYNDSSITTKEACDAVRGTFGGVYSGGSGSSWCTRSSSPEQDANLILSAGWMADCFYSNIQSGYYDISAEDLQGYKFTYGEEPIIGHILTADDGRSQCTKSSNVQADLTRLGFTDMLQMFKYLGATPDGSNGSYKYPSFNSKQDVYTKLINYKYENVSLTDYDKYYIALKTFQVGCKATQIASPTSADRNVANGNTGKTYNVALVDETWSKDSTLPAIFVSELDRGDTISTLNSASSAGWTDDGSFQCHSLADMTLSYANAYKKWLVDNPTVSTGPLTPPPPATTANTCAITGIGWIICPVLSFLGDVADKAYSYLADNYLSVDTQTVSTSSGTYTAWSLMRNIANVAFVIAFLFIIFSQLTGQGVSNYGVKKMLPRIIIAAILVNISFFICQIAVDLSNILGVSLKSLFETAGGTFNPISAAADQSNNWAGIIVGVIAGTSIAWALGLSVLLPFLIGAVIAVLMTFVILVVRQMLIILLVAVAPIAFVAYILPNTEQWFSKWRKMFTGLLLVFPTIGLLFGAAALASGILKTVYSGNAASPDTTSNVIGQIVAQGVLVLPLFLLPSLLKSSINAAGSIGTKLNGIGSKVQGSAKKQTAKTYGNSRLGQFGKYREGETAKRRALIQSGAYSGKGGRLNPRNWGSNLNKGINESGFSGRFGDRALATGTAIADKEDTELVANAATRLDNVAFKDSTGREVPLTQKQMMQIARKKDVTDAAGNVLAPAHTFDEFTRRAAIQKAARIATVNDAHELVDASSGMTKAERKTLTSSMAGSSVLAKASYLGGRTLGEIEQGTANSDSAALQAISDGKISAEVLAATDKNSAKKLLDVAIATPQGSPERKALMQAYGRLNDPTSRLREKIVPGSEHDIILQGMRSL